MFHRSPVQHAQPAQQLSGAVARDRAPLAAGGHLGQAAHAAALDQPDARRRCAGFEQGLSGLELNDFAMRIKQILQGEGGGGLTHGVAACASRSRRPKVPAVS